MEGPFLTRLASGRPIVADGGMGVLVSSTLAPMRCPEEANLRAPDAVVSVHVSFIRAGAELIETNTFGANRRKLAARFLEDEFERINSAAVKLARDARDMTGHDVFVAGSIGPLGDTAGTSRDEQAHLFAEQAAILEGRGVDLFMIETFSDLDELTAAIEGVRSTSRLPIVALLTFDDEAQTLAGASAQEAALRLAEEDVVAIGANHGSGPQAALVALEEMGGASLPLAALPNIGLASISARRVVFPQTRPDYFAEFAAHARSLGARIIGGCCGTTPVEIAAIRSAIEEGREPHVPLVGAAQKAPRQLFEDREETELARKLREGEWVISAQLDPPLGGSLEGLLQTAEALKESGLVDVVDLNDNAGARVSMSAMIASAAIERRCGLETIPHLTTRDTRAMGLESLLLGAHGEGIRNVLAMTGDPPEVGGYPGQDGVYEIDSIGLTQLISRLNRGEDARGKPIDAPTSFFIGVVVNPTADDLDAEVERFRRKIEAGAQFGMTQLVFDMAYFDTLLERLGGSSPIPLLVGICPLWSYRLALRFHNELPGVVVPEPIQEALRDAGPNAAEVGMNLARELLAEARTKAAGAYLVAPFRKPLAILELLHDYATP